MQGTKLKLHDDASGSFSDSVERNLLHLSTNIENLVDRFDVRLLLEEVPQAPSARCAEQLHNHHTKMNACRSIIQRLPCHMCHLWTPYVRGQVWLTRRHAAAAALNKECSEEELDQERYADLAKHQEADPVVDVLLAPGIATPDVQEWQ